MSQIRKAIAAGIGTLGTGLVSAAVDGTFAWVEVLVVVGGALATFGATWGMVNSSDA